MSTPHWAPLSHTRTRDGPETRQTFLCTGNRIDVDDNWHHDAFMRTTINISDGILAEVRELARQRKRPFREVLEEVVQRGLAAGSAPRKRVRLLTRRVGIKPAYLARSMNELYDQVEAEAGAMRGGR